MSVITSCAPKTTDPGKYSDAFIPVFNKTNKLFDLNNYEAGVKYLDSAFNLISKPSLDDKLRFYSYHFVYNKKVSHNYQKCLLYADSMLAIANKSVNPEQYSRNYAEANFAMGDAYFELKQFNDSYQYYYQGYLTGKNYVNKLALGDYTYRMGMIMYKKSHYKLAVNYFKDSFNQQVSINHDFPIFFRKQELLDNIGLSYKHNNQNDSALVYFDKTLSYLDKNGGQFKERSALIDMARGVVYGNKAEVYIANKSYDQAIALLKKSISINLQKGLDNQDAEIAEIKLGQIYLDQRKNDSLYTLLFNLRNQLDSVKNPDAEADWNRLLGNYYLQKRDLEKAISHIQKYNWMKDSIAKSSILLRESDVDQQLANYEKQHEIDTLSNNNKLQMIYVYVATLFAVMASLIIFLVYRNWRNSNKEVRTVNLLNEQINQKNTELESALTELKDSAREKDRILRTVAHDLRNPIGGIASLTAMMIDDDYTEEQKELITLVKETSFNSLELINEILEATNIASVPLNLERVEINSLVSNSVELLRFKAAEKGQTINLETLNTPQELYISREKIWRVISNLISNATKFSPSGATINVSVTEKDDEIIIAVKDYGIGIPEKLKDQIFNMFTTAQRPGTAGEKSFGLGLSICRQIMEKHKGNIWFESNAIGTTFYISLPITGSDTLNTSTQKAGVPMS
ncbi:tetratricopeptide repeat-containing sensor histidine kinase [Mucilaginibacter segetis]|nr:HAMP domain-containing sensor histidine kinase [Mucilaginibacter segetis]